MSLIEKPDPSMIPQALKRGISLTITYYPFEKKVEMTGEALQDRDLMYVMLGRAHEWVIAQGIELGGASQPTVLRVQGGLEG